MLFIDVQRGCDVRRSEEDCRPKILSISRRPDSNAFVQFYQKNFRTLYLENLNRGGGSIRSLTSASMFFLKKPSQTCWLFGVTGSAGA